MVVGECSLCGGVVVQDDIGNVRCRACGAEMVPATLPVVKMEKPKEGQDK